VFRFKHFNIDDDGCVLKTNTDAVLLGAWCRTGEASYVLDIGTGCGVIALMLAQRSGAVVHALEPDPLPAGRAEANFSNSPWKDRLSLIPESLQVFAGKTDAIYDLVVTNPPFFRRSLKPGSARRSAARHDTTLTHEDLLFFIPFLLRPGGRLAVILPHDAASGFIAKALRRDLFCTRLCHVYPVEGKKPHRMLMEFHHGRNEGTTGETLAILRPDRSPTRAYRELTRDFYLSF
jgi:tRNA1Val (adenine37-N6)-methyltransferase